MCQIRTHHSRTGDNCQHKRAVTTGGYKHAGAKIKRYNGRNCIAHTERRENDKLLDLVIQAVHGHGVLAHLRDSGQNQIERVGHNGQQRLGNDGGQTEYSTY